MTKKTGRGWRRVGTFRTRQEAQKRAKKVRPVCNKVIVVKGTKGKAFFQEKIAYRVWCK